jgi:hypothetical protein
MIEPVTVWHIECKNRKSFLRRLKKITESYAKPKEFNRSIVTDIETKDVRYSRNAWIAGYILLNYRIR